MNNKKNEICNIVFVIAFAIMICLPLLFLNHNQNKISVIENRTLAVKPNLWQQDGSLNKDFITEFEDWFNDNIGFKGQALAGNIIFKYKLFGVLDIPNWIEGDKGNFFYTTGGKDIETYAGKNLYSQETMQELSECLISMNRYFEQKGCKTYNMFIPNKEAVYSELYDEDVYHAEESRLDILTGYIKENTELNVFNVKQALINHKAENLYYKSYDGSHWNMNGAFIGYRELMSVIQKDYPEIVVLEKEDFEIREEPYTGLMSYYSDVPIIHNMFDIEDVLYHYDLRGGYHAVISQEAPGGLKIDSNLNFYYVKNESIDNNQKLFIIGDSYMYSFLLPMLGESFSEVYFIRNTNAEIVTELVEMVEPTIFLFEMAERVCTEEYLKLMAEYEPYLEFDIDLNQYNELNMVSEIHIDVPAVVNSTISFSDLSDDVVSIMGWAFDAVNDQKPQAVIAEVNGVYINTTLYHRKDLAALEEKYGDCAFQVQLRAELLKNTDEIQFYVITQNGEKYQAYTVMLQ